LSEGAEIIKEPGLYKGFSLIDPNLKAIPDPADGNKFKVSTIDSNKPVRYTKKNIDDFRDFADNYTGPNADIFTKQKTIKNKNVGNVQVFANRLPEECLGFQPGDIYRTNTSYLYRNGLKKFKGFSKVIMDIWAAQNAEEAMDLAFFGKDYEEPLSYQETRKGNPPFLQCKKHPNINLQFNEISGLSKLNTLNIYYEALKNVTECL